MWPIGLSLDIVDGLREKIDLEITEGRESCPYSLMWVQPVVLHQVGGLGGG